MASMTHELRTPMNVVIGMIDCAIENFGNLSNLTTEYLQPAHYCSHLLLNQINNIIDYGLLRNNQLKLNEEVVDIRE